MSLPSAGELFFLFSHTPVDLLTHLAELESCTEDLVLLLLESALGLLEGSLQLLLLLLQVAPLLVEVVDGPAALAELVQQILDLIRKILERQSYIIVIEEYQTMCIYLVLPLHNVKLLNSFILSRLQPEEL